MIENHLVYRPNGAKNTITAEISPSGEVTYLNTSIPLVDSAKEGSIVLPDRCHLESPSTRPYAILSLEMLATQELGGERVIDLGCAEGLQSAVAMRLGALKATGVELDANWHLYLQQLCERNNLEIGFVQGNICDKNTIIDSIRDGTVVVANMGRHYGELVHTAIYTLLDHLPDVRKIIAGGYAKRQEYSPEKAIRMLRNRGFSHYTEISDEKGRIAFSMRKQ